MRKISQNLSFVHKVFDNDYEVQVLIFLGARILETANVSGESRDRIDIPYELRHLSHEVISPLRTQLSLHQPPRYDTILRIVPSRFKALVISYYVPYRLRFN